MKFLAALLLVFAMSVPAMAQCVGPNCGVRRAPVARRVAPVVRYSAGAFSRVQVRRVYRAPASSRSWGWIRSCPGGICR